MHQPVDIPDDPLPIKFVRLSTGEDVITELLSVKDDAGEYYIFLNPLKVVYLVGEKPGSLMLSLIEWVFPKICAKQEFTVFPSDIVTVGEPSEQITDYYYEALFKLEKQTKVKMVDKSEMDYKEDMKDITDDELEYLTEIMETLKNSKRNLH